MTVTFYPSIYRRANRVLIAHVVCYILGNAAIGNTFGDRFYSVLKTVVGEITGQSRGIQAADTGSADSPSSARNVLLWREPASRPRTPKFALTPTKFDLLFTVFITIFDVLILCCYPFIIHNSLKLISQILSHRLHIFVSSPRTIKDNTLSTC